MTVIDVDTHWESTGIRRSDHPLAPWLDRVPTASADALAFGIMGDLLRALPEDRRPDGRSLLPGLVAAAEERGGALELHPQHESSAEERVAWMDSVGIDHCLVNPGGYWQNLELLPDVRAQAAARCNDYLAEQLASQVDRLHGVAVLDLSDLPGAARELERARALGLRAFFLYTLNGRPPGDVPPGHPDWDVVWSAATDLGMVAVIHIGNTAASFDGWADIGWDLPGGAGVSGLSRLANTRRTHVAEDLLASMLYGGTFARHPDLTVIVEEHHIGWVPYTMAWLGGLALPMPALGDWPWELSGADMLERNVRITPLPGLGDLDALQVVSRHPNLCLFSSDYPHQEGNADPIALYGPQLDELAPEIRAGFLGGNAAGCFARMGDPLPTVR
jgi:predicted TIM-barrel fold metal-dependent hydrolase